jgi:4-amino-4-deoxy-L-arabinose transferase-like glycosyltransferase
MVGVDLGQRILATNDEARFPLLAQDMLTRGAWFFPQLNGVAYNAKPPLLVWLIALASWPAGAVTQLTAVLPSAAAGVGLALVVYAAGRAMFGVEAGRLAALALVTTQGWVLHSRVPMPDMLMTLFLTAAVAMLWPMTRGRSGPWWLGFYGAAGAAFWAKGWAALAALAVAVAWAAASRRAGRWRALRLPAGLLLLAAIIAPWYLGKLLLERAAMGQVFVQDSLLWYLPRSPNVLIGPPQHLFGILFPWALVAPLAAWQAVRAIREDRAERDGLLFLLVWSLALLVCFGIAEQQRLRYYLPLAPPAALLVGWWGARAVETRGGAGGVPWRVYAVIGAVLAVSAALSLALRRTWLHATHVSFPTSALEVVTVAGGLLLMIAALVHGVRRGGLPRAFAVAWLGAALSVAGAYHWELERRNAAYDYPRVRAEARRLLPETPVVAAWGIYELPFSFYLGRRVAAVGTAGDLRRVMSEYPRASAVLTESALAQMPERGDLQVVPLDRLDFSRIVLVSLAAGPPRADGRP